MAVVQPAREATRGRRAAPIAIIGAGPAGIATARELARRGLPYRLLEQGDSPAHVWRNLYDSLTLHTGKHMSALPGMPFPAGTSLFPTRSQFVAYLDAFIERFGIRVETGVHVRRAVPASRRLWVLQTSIGDIDASAVVMATGIVSWPVVPSFPGQEEFTGRILHSNEYNRPDPFAGKRVLVVGCGNSGAEIASELGNANADVTIAIRTGANVVPLTILGVPIQYIAYGVRKLPPPARKALVSMVRRVTLMRQGPPVLPMPPWDPLDRIPLIGFHLVDAIRAGKVRVKPAIRAFQARGVSFTDGTEGEYDVVILATGYRAALQPIEGLVRVDKAGFALRKDRVTSADCHDLYFVGHNYDSAGGLMNIAQDSILVADILARN